jgi:hypothetical protein
MTAATMPAEGASFRNWSATEEAKWWKRRPDAAPERVIRLPPEWPRKRANRARATGQWLLVHLQKR